jgi:hypothetical protein
VALLPFLPNLILLGVKMMQNELVVLLKIIQHVLRLAFVIFVRSFYLMEVFHEQLALSRLELIVSFNCLLDHKGF